MAGEDHELPQGLLARIETASLHTWPPREVAMVGGWLTRATADDLSHRANSCQVAAMASGSAPAAAIRAVEGWYTARTLRPCFQVSDHAAPAVDAALEAAGYEIVTPSLVLWRPLGLPLPPAALEVGTLDLETRMTPGVMQAVLDPRWSPTARAGRAALFGRLRRPATFALARVGGEPAAGGLGVVSNGLLAVASMRTQAPFRRRGLARAVLLRLLGWGSAMGAAQAFLQVDAANVPAMQLYGALGFQRAYRYWYREISARS